ncbi:pyruvate, water dikinase [Oceanidesulfovibrio indonesiensis]|uniref:Phosphoenolpyruvate synthase n=1 Tax=Oceanidesulfovibrio indonesiensis TaxID=54767 RepID=A0A7M3MD26_9BACT|nr:PEP/pyruvate-binding domain-containing protein [Oceanidesulfovibrio indonesiensis]TVM16428.1 pyruvate, water dikinase [Oceanidesulfovibrio indonesiensis]
MPIGQLFKHWTYQVFAPGSLLRAKYTAFKSLLEQDDYAMQRIADLEEIHYGGRLVDWAMIRSLCDELSGSVEQCVRELMEMSPTRYMGLMEFFRKIDFYVRMGVDLPEPNLAPPYVIPLAGAAGDIALAGGKAAAIARAAARVPTPPGLVLTTRAFEYFLETAALRDPIKAALSRVDLADSETVRVASQTLVPLVRNAEMPKAAVEELKRALPILEQETRDMGLARDDAEVRFAVRSSGVFEDGSRSFAGQFESVLNVPASGLVDACKEVLASRYHQSAIAYRVRAGLADEETPMAVLVMPMIDARNAGVVLSRDASRGGARRAGIYVVDGPGQSLVDGSRSGLTYQVERDENDALSLAPTTTPPPLLRTGDSLLDLARYAVRLEQAAAEEENAEALPPAREIEWVEDVSGSLWVLQSRPYAGLEEVDSRPAKEPEDVPDAPVLADLEVAAPGAGAGVVVHALGVPETSPPEGAVLVTATLPPQLASFVHLLSGVVSGAGSRASHLASVAREHGCPVFVSTDQDPFAALPEGSEVTLSHRRGRGRVHAGRLEALAGEKRPELHLEETPAGKRLAAVMPRISPLNLTNPDSLEFAPEHCRSLHDLIRFVHEKSVAEMFSLVDKGGRSMTRSKKLKTDLPIVLYVLDLEGGLFPSAAQSTEITQDDIASVPLWAVWWGLSDQEADWSQGMTHVDWAEFDRVSAGIFSKDAKFLASYAVISAHYMHMMIRFGYHFSVLDSMCGPDAKNNYINFRFQGGGAPYAQRRRRLEFIRRILSHYEFEIEIRGDMLEAQLKRQSEGMTQRRLAMLGYLMAVTRLLDMALVDDQATESALATFLRKTDR